MNFFLFLSKILLHIYFTLSLSVSFFIYIKREREREREREKEREREREKRERERLYIYIYMDRTKILTVPLCVHVCMCTHVCLREYKTFCAWIPLPTIISGFCCPLFPLPSWNHSSRISAPHKALTPILPSFWSFDSWKMLYPYFSPRQMETLTLGQVKPL